MTNLYKNITHLYENITNLYKHIAHLYKHITNLYKNMLAQYKNSKTTKNAQTWKLELLFVLLILCRSVLVAPPHRHMRK